MINVVSVTEMFGLNRLETAWEGYWRTPGGKTQEEMNTKPRNQPHPQPPRSQFLKPKPLPPPQTLFPPLPSSTWADLTCVLPEDLVLSCITGCADESSDRNTFITVNDRFCALLGQIQLFKLVKK